MVINQAQLLRAVPKTNRTRALEFVKVFNEWAERFGINTPLRTAHALAQFFHESNALNAVEENLNYSADGLLKVFPKYFNKENVNDYARKPEKIANRVYANRMGNGDEKSGDGWKYRGRGIVQITGKSNVLSYEKSGFCNGKVSEHPEWLAQSPGAYKSAMWFWFANGCNQLADRDDAIAVTKRINGATNGLSERMYYLRRFKREFGIS